MKRWQDRGEVLDSDDDENSLDAEVQRPAKRARLAGGNVGTAEQSTECGNAGEGEDGDGGKRTTHEPLPPIQNARENEDDDEDWLQPKPAVTYGRTTTTLSATQRASESRNPPASAALSTTDSDGASLKPPSSHQSHIDVLPQDANRDSSQLNSEFGDLADAHELPGGREVGHADHEGWHHLLSTPSSPLSERDVSPSPPPLAYNFHFSTLPLPVSAATGQSTYVVPNDVTDDAQVAVEIRASPGLRRRNLRTRNEKQLHPYMFDKAQYQQQCRERGMRPLRVMEAAQQAAAETQDSSNESNGQSSQILFGNDSSSPRSISSAVGERAPNVTDDGPVVHLEDDVNDDTSEDELPDLPAIIQRSALDGVRQGHKRRRLLGTAQNRAAKLWHADRSCDHGDSSLPPSPPPTSSDQNDHHGTTPEVPKFRFPRGMTPRKSLSTPRVSSILKPIHNGDDSEASGEELLPRRYGLPSSSRKTITVPSSSSPSEVEEEEPGLDDKRLHRERRRIKGVLPASWLKIDFRTQQKPLSLRKAGFLRTESSSPERTSPQKGIAQRIVSRRSASPRPQQTIDISDDESDAAIPGRLSSPSPPRVRQTRLPFIPSQQTRTRPDFVDVDEMEVDWIDPMFGGASSGGNTHLSKKRQPKIADAFEAAPRRLADVSGEQIGRRAMIGTTRHKSNKNPRKSRIPHPQAPRLSILDAPSPTPQMRFRQPQFVRLAARQARNRSDDGRHSPSNKHVRLATKEDTETAEAVLRAWREGTIRPRHSSLQNRRIEPNSARAEQSYHEGAPVQQLRTPLTELSRNVPQRNPFELKEKTSKQRVEHVAIAQSPRFPQTRLRLEAVDRYQSSPELGVHKDAAPRAPIVRQIRPQPSRARYRGAQMESLESDFDQRHRTAAFERRMQRLTKSVSRRGRTTRDEQLERFLYGSTPASAMERRAVPSDMSMRKNLEVPGPMAVLPHRHRKRIARRMDAEAREYRQPSEPLPDVSDDGQLPNYASDEPTPTLQGLGPFGTRYATDFDLFPLALGTYFHQDSFIGSGDFAAALNFAGRNLDRSTGHLSIHVDGDVLEWGWWTEEVATGLARIPRAVSDMLESLQADNRQADVEMRSLVLSNVDYLLRSVIRYLARCLAFLDPVDRQSCIQRIHAFVEDLFERLDDFSTTVWANGNIRARCLYFTLVITKQAHFLSGHSSVASEVRNDSEKSVGRAAHRLAASMFPGALSDLRAFYEDNRHASKREAGIHDDNFSVTSMIIMYHALNETGAQSSLFWTVIYEQLNINASQLASVLQFDKAWYDIFTLLPVLEIDAKGIARVGFRLNGSQVDWSLPRMLIERLFVLYDASSHVSGSTVNDYLRATLTRCYHMVSRWGWWRCESVLGVIFDFFARRGLAQLHKEDSRGSPKFLEDLKDVPPLEIQAGDPSFHIFLKLLASSLIGIRQHGVYADKRIGGIAWRFIPNHGRTYQKDTEVKQQDLDALRNHHDLLCTLYYAAPSKHRLRLEVLWNLVDHSVSHREACRLSVRSWANLASFQISTVEDDQHLEPLVEWCREMLSTTKTQYRHAKNEVDQDVQSARAQGEFPVPQHIIDDTIARNQRQISATLVDLLVAVKRVLQSASSVQIAIYFLRGCAFWDVLDLYDPTSRRLNDVLDEVLSVVQTALEIEEAFSSAVESQGNSDESQDYGDSSALLELASSERRLPKFHESPTDLLHEPVNQLLSNLFGADTASDDYLLTKAVDTWVQLAQRRVRSGESSWTRYINGYTSTSWNQLRDTAHQRKFTPYFISRMATFVRGPKVGIEILGPWVESLVEREALLSHQHTFTSNLVNSYTSEPLFNELPIYGSAKNAIMPTIQEFQVRRLELIAQILFNMRERLDSLARQKSCDLQLLQIDYAALLRKMMDAMKARYQQLNRSNNSESVSGREQGSYAAFVHRVISLMQEYTSDICPIDGFFTDSNNFPLPSSDPTYVVGKLKAYASKLGNSGQRKQLVMFIRTVSERAARQHQQKYLVGQLVDAMSIEAQQDNADALRLPHVLMTAIFPVYIERALSTSCLWIISIPVLQACSTAIERMLYQVDFQNQASVVTVTEIIITFFRSMITTMDYALGDTTRIQSSHAHALCSVLFNAAQVCLTMAHHLCKKYTEDARLKEMLELFAKYAEEVEAAAMSNFGVLEAQRYSDEIPQLHCRWADALEFTRTVALGASFSQSWYTEQGRVFMRRGSGTDEVILPLEDGADQRVELLGAIASFRKSHSRIFGGGEIERYSRRESSVAFGVASGLVIL